MKNSYIRIFFLAGLLASTSIACSDLADPIIEQLDFERAFSPIELEARVRNKTTLEVTWKVREDADHYVVEFSQDSLEFKSIIRTVTVKPNELPVSQTFESETRYSARVKAVSASGAADSKWSQVTIETEKENIFKTIPNGAIDKTSVTLSWPESSEVTHLIVTPGNIRHDITDAERAAGSVTIAGLTDDTPYTATLYNEAKQRGQIAFTTLVDGVTINPTHDLNAAIAAAAPGTKLVLDSGKYTVYTGKVVIDKSIAIRARYPYAKPKVYVQFMLQAGANDVTVSDLDMNGTYNGTVQDNAFDYATNGTYGALTVKGCLIHDYNKSLVTTEPGIIAEIANISFDDCIATNVFTSGGDFIDFRTSYAANINLTNSTFYKCAAGRDFVRQDAAAGLTSTGKTCSVLIDHCTLYGVSNTQDRILYVRFTTNVLTVRNTLIAATDGFYTNQSLSTQPICTNNAYFNAPGFYTAATNVKTDNGTYSTFDPGFKNAAAGDFTISNQTLIDKAVGDPRWRQ